jgi:DNA-directed RNA polymerase subunit M/transcription elongation factor TFIIS
MDLVIKKKQNQTVLADTVKAHDVSLYDVLHIVDTAPNKREALSRLIAEIREYGQEYIWRQAEFEEYRTKLEEEYYFQSNPIDFEEGVLDCFRCGSKKTISFQRQTRSADEGATTFAQCVECKHRWRHNN